MYNVRWNPVNPVALAEKLFSIGQEKNAVVPVSCSAQVAAGLTQTPDCLSDAQWAVLETRTQEFGEDGTMWGTPGSEGCGAGQGPCPKFAVAGLDKDDATAGWIYPAEEKQTLGRYFYTFLVEECT